MQCREEIRSNPYGYIEETSGDLHKLTGTCALLTSTNSVNRWFYK